MKLVGFSRSFGAVFCAIVAVVAYAKAGRVPVGTGSLNYTQTWQSDAAAPACLGSGAGSVTATFAADGTFSVALPNTCNQGIYGGSICHGHSFSGTALAAQKKTTTTVLTVDSASIPALFQYPRSGLGHGNACTVDSATVSQATLMLDKRQRNAKLHVSATATTSFNVANPTTINYTLDATGPWQKSSFH